MESAVFPELEGSRQGKALMPGECSIEKITGNIHVGIPCLQIENAGMFPENTEN